MTADPNDPYVGRTIAGKYEIESQIGVGSVGTVYRARHVQLGRRVALKILRASLAADPENVARFAREARLASQLDHPNVVAIFDHGEEPDGLSYVVMELLEGEDLGARLARERRLAPERIVALMAQLLGALGAAHRLGIVHRDLKPENILLVQHTDDDGKPVEVVKVADFGIAKSFGPRGGSDTITQYGVIHGTPEYMSPEQARGDELDGRSDLYACGAILYEMLCGRPPFVGETALEVLEQHLRAPVTPPSQRANDVDPRLEPVALRALEKNRDERYADAAAMRAALVAALDEPLPAASVTSVVVELGPSAEMPGEPSIIIEHEALPTSAVAQAPNAAPARVAVAVAGRTNVSPLRSRRRLVAIVASVALLASVVLLIVILRGRARRGDAVAADPGNVAGGASNDATGDASSSRAPDGSSRPARRAVHRRPAVSPSRPRSTGR